MSRQQTRRAYMQAAMITITQRFPGEARRARRNLARKLAKAAWNKLRRPG